MPARAEQCVQRHVGQRGAKANVEGVSRPGQHTRAVAGDRARREEGPDGDGCGGGAALEAARGGEPPPESAGGGPRARRRASAGSARARLSPRWSSPFIGGPRGAQCLAWAGGPGERGWRRAGGGRARPCRAPRAQVEAYLQLCADAAHRSVAEEAGGVEVSRAVAAPRLAACGYLLPTVTTAEALVQGPRRQDGAARCRTSRTGLPGSAKRRFPGDVCLWGRRWVRRYPRPKSSELSMGLSRGRVASTEGCASVDALSPGPSGQPVDLPLSQRDCPYGQSLFSCVVGRGGEISDCTEPNHVIEGAHVAPLRRGWHGETR